MTSSQHLLNTADIEKVLEQMVQGMIDPETGVENICLVGIRTRGAVLAQRFQTIIHKTHGKEVPLGILDITLYRDDLTLIASHPVVHETLIDFDLTDKVVILVDDVLFTGRTVRAALDAMNDLGRPKKVKLAVLVDRGHRELPIQGDIVGLKQETQLNQNVKVILSETDNKDDEVIILNQ